MKQCIIVCYCFLLFPHYFLTGAEIGGNQMTKAVQSAVAITLMPTDGQEILEVTEIQRSAFKLFKYGSYDEALQTILDGLQQFPKSFDLQNDLAMILSDHAGSFIDIIQKEMLEKSKNVFRKLYVELDITKEPKDRYFHFRNEFYFAFCMFKEQYELGIEKFNTYWQTDRWESRAPWCYYTQGVGAANYAKQLLMNGNKQVAVDYAQKAVIAWAQHFSSCNDYYNSYVHYAYALAILDKKQEMIVALHKSAALIKKDFDYHEFKNLLAWVKMVEKAGLL